VLFISDVKFYVARRPIRSGFWRQSKTLGTFSIRNSPHFGMSTEMVLVKRIFQQSITIPRFNSLYRRNTWQICFTIVLDLVLLKWYG